MIQEPLTTLAAVAALAKHIENEFGDYHECCLVVTPPLGAVVEVSKPLRSPFLIDPEWGTENLVDGCVPPGRYRVEASSKHGKTQHFVDLEPINGGPKITACAGYAEQSNIDWTSVANVGEKFPPASAEVRFARAYKFKP